MANRTGSPPSKPEIILTLVGRKRGAGVDVLQNATGWQSHSVRAALTGLRKKGHFIECTRNPKDFSVYRLVKDASA
mgnify:CR=1 FL=1